MCVVWPVQCEASKDLLFRFPRFARSPTDVSLVKVASSEYCQEELAALLSCMRHSHGELAALVGDIMSVGRFSFVLLF